MAGHEPLQQHGIGLSDGEQPTGRRGLSDLAHRPSPVYHLRDRDGKATTQAQWMRAAKQPHIARVGPALDDTIRPPTQWQRCCHGSVWAERVPIRRQLPHIASGMAGSPFPCCTYPGSTSVSPTFT